MSNLFKSKLIHYTHLTAVGFFIFLLFFMSGVEIIISLAILINFLHPEHKCYFSFLENKYRKRANLNEIKWLKFYILSGKPFRKD